MAAFKRRRSKPLRFITAPLPVDHPSWLDLDRQLPPDHLARRIRFLVEQLDLDSLLETYSGVGGALYPPDLLLAFVLFETQRGRLSPAQWFTDSRESIPGRWLLRGLLPTRSTFYRFRKHLPAELVDELNRSVLLLAQAEGHTTADNGSLDGTFTAAYGSRHRLLNRITLRVACTCSTMPSPQRTLATCASAWRPAPPSRAKRRRPQRPAQPPRPPVCPAQPMGRCRHRNRRLGPARRRPPRRGHSGAWRPAPPSRAKRRRPQRLVQPPRQLVCPTRPLGHWQWPNGRPGPARRRPPRRGHSGQPTGRTGWCAPPPAACVSVSAISAPNGSCRSV